MPSSDSVSLAPGGEPRRRRRVGRPPKVDEHGTPTRERLLEAGARSFADNGFEATKLAEVARAADVSAPAIYTHFADKDEFLLEAVKWSLLRLRTSSLRSSSDPHAVARRFLSPDFADARKVLLELHSASLRHPHLHELVGGWFGGGVAITSERDGAMSKAEATAYYLLLMGLCHVDVAFEPDEVDGELLAVVDRLITCLLADDPT